MPKPRKRSVIGDTLVAFFGNSSGYVVAIVTGIVVARVLGPAGKGVASYAALVMALFTTFGAGLQAAVMHECGKKGTPRLLAYGAAMRLFGFTMLPAAAGLMAVAVLDPRHASFAYVACAIPFAVYLQLANGLLLLYDDVRSTIVVGAIPTFGVALFTIPALTIFHGGLNAVLAIWAAMFAVSGCFALVRLGSHQRALSLGGSWSLVRDEAGFGLKSGAASLATFLNLRIDVFVVSALLDARTLGIYTLAVATGELMWQVSRPLTWTTAGRIASEDRERAIALTNTVTRNIIAVECVLAIALFALAPLAVEFVYGPAYAESGSIVRWLLPGLIVYATQGPLVFFIMVREGRPMATLAVQVGSVVACATISILTIGRLGVVGAALATTITYICAAIATGVLYARSTGSPVRAFTLLQREDIERFRRLLERVRPERAPLTEPLGAES